MTHDEDLYRVRDWEEREMEMHRNEWRNFGRGVLLAAGITLGIGALLWRFVL